MRSRSKITTWSLCSVMLVCVCARGAEPSAQGVEFFEQHIRPVLAERCYQCHSTRAEKVKGGLRLDSREQMLKGGKDGMVLVPGDPDKSKLIEAIRYINSDLQMPPKHQLSKQEVSAFERWVKMGAPDPRGDALPSAPATQPAPFDYQKERQFWSFQPVRDAPAPDVKDTAGLISPVDYFLESDCEAHHLHPTGPAPKRALIRRATYDLTGLPPTPDEVNAFVADESPNAFEKLVDRLLASPHYGEQWGRHWLDVVRYADTAGDNADFPVPQLYKYRNYVIDAFNNDKAYDQFLREQLAGDLLPARNEAEKHEHVIATGYIALSRRFGSRNAEFWLTIQDTIDNVGKSMLGLSLGCARCHDHKFDPIPTSDYYALYGIFASTTYAFPGTEIYNHPKDFVALAPPDEARKLKDYYDKLADLDDRIEKLVQERAPLLARQKALKQATTQPTTRPVDLSIDGRTLKEVLAELAEAREELHKLEYFGPPNVDRAFGVSEGNAHDVRVQRKGMATDLGERVHRGFLQILGGQKVPDDEKGSGRLELANWITDASNPLTARVMVNRIWQHHFGVGIVATPNDFGHRGQPPTNPALLHYLAKRFIESGWSIKAMDKLIMLSRAYQMASVDDPANAAIDPNNKYLWRFNPRRLSAEEIRDSILADSGSLDATVDPGPHPFPPESDWHYTQHKAFVADYPTDRRSMYLMQQRIRKQPYLAVFDGADTNDTSPDRPLSTTSIQALFMLNDSFMHDQADKLGVRVGLALPDEAKRVDYAYRLLFARPPTDEEIRVGQQYLRGVELKLKQANVPWDRQYRDALASYLRVLLSSNEWVRDTLGGGSVDIRGSVCPAALPPPVLTDPRHP